MVDFTASRPLTVQLFGLIVKDFHGGSVGPFYRPESILGAAWKVFLTLAGLLLAIWEIFKVNANTTTEGKKNDCLGPTPADWTRHICTTANLEKPDLWNWFPVFFLPFFSLFFWSAPLLITWQGHQWRLSGLIHGLPAAIFWFVSERAISRGSVHSCRLIVGEPCRWSDTATVLRCPPLCSAGIVNNLTNIHVKKNSWKKKNKCTSKVIKLWP